MKATNATTFMKPVQFTGPLRAVRHSPLPSSSPPTSPTMVVPKARWQRVLFAFAGTDRVEAGLGLILALLLVSWYCFALLTR